MTDNGIRGTRTVRIAIVDDDPAVLAVLEGLLAREHYKLSLFTRGKQLLSAMHDVRPDVIVLDVKMPDMDGYEICRTLKANANTCDIPVIFLSGLSGDEDVAAAFHAGCVDYVTKPVRQQELLARLTTQVRLHLAHKRLTDQHILLQEMETRRDTLVHMVAHDMRTPLQAILGHLQLLEHDAIQHLDNDSRESLTLALAATRKLSGLVTEMLDVSRMENRKLPIKAQPIEIRPFLENLIKVLKTSKNGHAIAVQAEESCPRVFTDPRLLERIVLNLIDNAMKYSPLGSEITLRAESGKDVVQLSVRDQGKGIPDAHKEQVFEKFATFHNETGSALSTSGLGLAFCKLAVEQQGGLIGYNNLPEGGCQFWFTLPVAPPV